MNGTNGQPHGTNGGQPRVPIAPAWIENGAHAMSAQLALERGAIQFAGRRPLGINDETMTVPLGVLVATLGAMLQQMQAMLALAAQPGPQGDMLRAIFAAQNLKAGG